MTIWKAKSNLRGSKCEDLPAIMQQNRRVMLPYYLAARRKKYLGKCTLFQDSIILNGIRYAPDDIHKLPVELQQKRNVKKPGED